MAACGIMCGQGGFVGSGTIIDTCVGSSSERAGPAMSDERVPMQNIEERLAELGVTLPEAPPPVATYVPYVICTDMVYVSGQISACGDRRIAGRLGDTVDVETGRQAARLCAVNLLAHLKNACGGDLERLVQIVKLTGFVNSTADFGDQPTVISGASDFLVELFGSRGQHSRSAVGVAALPFGVAVEIEGIFRIAPP